MVLRGISSYKLSFTILYARIQIWKTQVRLIQSQYKNAYVFFICLRGIKVLIVFINGGGLLFCSVFKAFSCLSKCVLLHWHV